MKTSLKLSGLALLLGAYLVSGCSMQEELLQRREGECTYRSSGGDKYSSLEFDTYLQSETGKKQLLSQSTRLLGEVLSRGELTYRFMKEGWPVGCEKVYFQERE